MSKSWRPIGISDEDAAMVDGSTAAGRKVYTNSSGTAADASAPTFGDGFKVAFMQYVSLVFKPTASSGDNPAGSMTIRLWWYDENSGEYIPETSTITIPHADAPSASKNHEEQRAVYGKAECYIAVETKSDNTDVLEVWANGAEDR